MIRIRLSAGKQLSKLVIEIYRETKKLYANRNVLLKIVDKGASQNKVEKRHSDIIIIVSLNLN